MIPERYLKSSCRREPPRRNTGGTEAPGSRPSSSQNSLDLESELQPELNLARPAVTAQVAEGGRGNVVVHVNQVDVIERVEHLCAELHAVALAHAPVLVHRE